MAAPRLQIGIMGGTFDPIHTGHLVTAEDVRTRYGLDKIIFIPAGNPPHKAANLVSPALHRYIMTVLATFSNPYFHVSDIELRRQGPSYTIDTLRSLKEIYPDRTRFFFIMGADALLEFPTWHNTDDFLSLCHIIAATRPGCTSMIVDVIQAFGLKGSRKIHRLDTPELAISSTNIRERVRNGDSIKYIVPESVESYISKQSLYLGTQPNRPNIGMHI